MEEKGTFHAGRVFEPLGNGKTRVKTYAEGGALLSSEILPDAEAKALIGQPVTKPRLPLRVEVTPELGPLRPDQEWDDRDQVTGHTVKPEGGRMRESVFYATQAATVRAWLEEHGYRRVRDLENKYMAEPIDGVYIRAREDDEL